MNELLQYMSAMVTSAVICTIVSAVTENCSAKQAVKFLCGVVMTVTVLTPLKSFKFDRIPEINEIYTRDSNQLVSDGSAMAERAKETLIKENVQAYILDKARELNADLTVEVAIGENRTPTGAILEGEISPYGKDRLSEILEKELGITKEKQTWTG